MIPYRFIAAATLCTALALQGACSVANKIIGLPREILGPPCSPFNEPPPAQDSTNRAARHTGLAGVYVRTAADSVAVGDTVMFNYELVPPKGQVVRSSAKVNWESSDTSVATVVNGWVVGKKVGVATIFVTADKVRGSSTITVTPKTQSGGCVGVLTPSC